MSTKSNSGHPSAPVSRPPGATPRTPSPPTAPRGSPSDPVRKSDRIFEVSQSVPVPSKKT